MQEDKKLKQILQQFAVEETPVDFTKNIMQQVESIAAKPATKLQVNSKLLWLLASVFVVILITLLVLCFTDQFTGIPIPFTFTIPENYISQLIRFIIVFWIGMLINILHRQRDYRFIKS